MIQGTQVILRIIINELHYIYSNSKAKNGVLLNITKYYFIDVKQLRPHP
jgi:hypothetical protein